jgi:hypothetical protein
VNDIPVTIAADQLRPERLIKPEERIMTENVAENAAEEITDAAPTNAEVVADDDLDNLSGGNSKGNPNTPRRSTPPPPQWA